MQKNVRLSLSLSVHFLVAQTAAVGILLIFSAFPAMFEYTSIAEEVQKRQRVRDHPNYVKVLYKDPDPILKNYKPEPCFLTERYKGHDQKIKEFQVRHDDIYIISYPKTGTTLLSEICTVLLSGMDFEKLEETSLMVRSPYLELVIKDLCFDLFYHGLIC